MMSGLAELSVEPLPAPPTQKGLAMRERLLKAAARAFTRRGYELTRVEDIVKAARTSYGNFYRHFRNKDEVLMAVLRPLLDEVYLASKRRAGPPGRRAGRHARHTRSTFGRRADVHHARPEPRRR